MSNIQKSALLSEKFCLISNHHNKKLNICVDIDIELQAMSLSSNFDILAQNLLINFYEMLAF
ncbi:hypothetical protein DERF_008953 [Dermatophagoides farinae]|uniref:Uncharacterized protein n=1 Tax=Dermatophagoides farinae TaxID=6954 RepID=A0A922HTW7_DERFA|nr:hypothetical protein DERF_008953 [Dermatophagoides farinae]